MLICGKTNSKKDEQPFSLLKKCAAAARSCGRKKLQKKKREYIMSFKEFCNKNWENILCFGAAGLMVFIGLIAFICIYASK